MAPHRPQPVDRPALLCMLLHSYAVYHNISALSMMILHIQWESRKSMEKKIVEWYVPITNLRPRVRVPTPILVVIMALLPLEATIRQLSFYTPGSLVVSWSC
jgi:hypothetical protein